ncbi:MAG: hypothetical protein IKA64_06040 [Clostridia bacterium]|nr:hypothetical protein [Clostridia bacterium]
MDWKRIGKALLFPHMAIMLLLLPFAAVLLVGSMVFVGTESAVAIVSYVIAAYTLTVWCFRIPYLIKLFGSFKSKNKYAIRWREDTRLRIKVSLYGALLWNALYGVFQLWLGFYHGTLWFLSLGAYYICLGVMRFFLVRHTRKYAPGERLHTELKKYRDCGIIFLVMNLALAVMIFFMVYWNRSFHHHEITTIALAAYTFTSLTVAIINAVKYRKYKSPIYSAAKAISLAAASVSLLTLEATMLTTFGAEMTGGTRRLFLSATGAAISALVISMAIYMIVRGAREIKIIRNGKNG